LLVLAMAAVLLVSHANVADASAKKKKINVVQCADVGFECVGTKGKDRLVGTPGAEQIFGKGGNDIYEANGGNTFLIDRSAKSSDIYTAVDPGEGRNTIINDAGGSADFLDMGSFRFDDVRFIRLGDELVLEGPELRRARVENHFGKGRIEKIKFANRTIKGREIENLTRQATSEEQAAQKERLPEDEGSVQEKEQ
jgi:Ca2+-binding RTX toxin-like protein